MKDKRPHIAASIFWTHFRRIGFLRTLFGGFLQYLSVFEFDRGQVERMRAFDKVNFRFCVSVNGTAKFRNCGR